MGGVGEELAAFDDEVVAYFLGLSVEDVNAMRVPTDQEGKARLREAQAFITEQQVQAWVAEQNECHGIAPTVGDVLRHRDELAAAQLHETEQQPLWSVASSARYKWATRFRRRSRLGLRKPHAREAVPLETARQKAVPFGGKGQTPSQFSRAKCFVFLFAFVVCVCGCPLTPRSKSDAAEDGCPAGRPSCILCKSLAEHAATADSLHCAQMDLAVQTCRMQSDA